MVDFEYNFMHVAESGQNCFPIVYMTTLSLFEFIPAKCSEELKSPLQQAAGNLPGKEFCNFYIRSHSPQQATGNALAVAGSNISKGVTPYLK
ncbi:MAG: hypothetical protein JSV38_11530 [Desulfobacterales bacterium]|nr:MAG: hypothetical protein JSV38_11530 [Desulfobacterales bacterium]